MFYSFSQHSIGSRIVDLTIYHRVDKVNMDKLAAMLVKLGLSGDVQYDDVERRLHDMLLNTATRRLQDQSSWKTEWREWNIPAESLSVKSTCE